MKKRIVSILLGTMMVIQPITNVYAVENTEVSSEQDKNIIEVSKENSNPVVYDKDGLKISVQGTSYDEISFGYKIDFMVENNSDKDVSLWVPESYVDEFKVNVYSGNTNVKSGKKAIFDCMILEDDFKSYGIDFKTWELNIEEINNVFEKVTVNVAKDVFSVSSNNDSQLNSDIEKNDNSDIEQLNQQIEDLESENVELNKKVTTLEEENKELKESNKKLKNSNKKLKKEIEELKATQGGEAEATPETTPEATQAPSEPVTEYKDATTIRIVQQSLNEAGFNCGTPDGISGGKTSQAITSYQTSKGITVNGLITDELLKTMGIEEKVQEAIKAEGAKNEYENYTYDQLARNPDTYMGKKVKINGKVLQAEDSGDTCYARIALNSNYDTVIFVTYDKSLLGYRLLEDDKVNVYGVSYGVYSYEAVSGATITIPWLNADIIEM